MVVHFTADDSRSLGQKHIATGHDKTLSDPRHAYGVGVEGGSTDLQCRIKHRYV